MPSKGGGGGNVQTPNLYTPSGLYQGLSSVEGLGSYTQSLFDSIGSATNWASNLATGGHGSQIPSAQESGLITGPQINIGGQHTPNDQWTSQFNPQTGEVTLTNTQTGQQFGNFFDTSEMQQWFGQDQIQQWQQLYNNRGQTAGGVTQGQTLRQELGPFLGQAWNQALGIRSDETQAQNFINQQEIEEAQFMGQGTQLFNEGQGTIGQGEGIVGQGENILNLGTGLVRDATTGEGLFPSQQAYVDQATQAEENQLSQQLASEGLGSSTANAILRGEAQQQGAATAGQLIQGNLTAAEGEQQVGNQTMGVGQQQISLGNQQISLAQQQYNLAQGASKLALGGQELKFGEQSALAQFGLNFQQNLWSEAMQGYGTLGQMISTAGSLYGVDITGYSNILQSHLEQNQLQAQVQEADAGLGAQAASSMGSGLGSILGMLGGGSSGGGLLGSGGIGGLFSGIGSLFGAGGGAAAGGLGAVGATAGGAAAGGGGAISGIIGALGGIIAAL